MPAPVVIRRAETPGDYRACQEAQRRAWGLVDDSYVVPVATMVGAQHHGGLVLGAFRPDGSAAGISFAFLGRIDGRECLYSQLTGVVPESRGMGLGASLKYAQREHCRAEGIGLMAWAFDPMQAGNARFNLMKLGATCRRLIPNMYGTRTDALNVGARTDRLIAEWGVDAGPRVDLDAAEIASLLPFGDEFERRNAPGPDRIVLEIPRDVAALRATSPEIANERQEAIVRLLSLAFEVGYRADGFARWDDAGEGRCGYILSR